MISLVTNLVFNLVIVIPMVRLGVPGPHAGLALATSIAAYVNAGLLFRVLYRRGIYRPRAGWRKYLLQIGVAAFVMGGVLWWAARPWRNGSPGLQDGAPWFCWPACVPDRRSTSLRCAPAVCGFRRCGLADTRPGKAHEAECGGIRPGIFGQQGRIPMELIRGIHNLRPRHRGCAATIGNFDGVHLGHQAVLGQLSEHAVAMHLPVTVITFEPQPREFFTPERCLRDLRD